MVQITEGYMDFFRFLFSRVFLKQLSVAISITVFMTVVLFLFLRIYTRHGQALSVPDLTGLSIQEADSLLQHQKLRYQIVDSVYLSSTTRGSIIDQNPGPEFKVKENRNIFLTINAFNLEIILMPNVVGVSQRQARSILETTGLRIGDQKYVPDIAINNVLQQMYKGNVIEEGDSIIKGSAVDLILGQGLSNEMTAAPDLIGLPIKQAKDRITTRYLNLGAVMYDGCEDSEDSAAAFIWRQSPEFDEEILINLGATIDIWLTVDSTKLTLPEEDQLPADDEAIFDNN